MPLTEKGNKILSHMKSEYGGEKKAEEVFYASKNKGTISGVDAVVSNAGGPAISNLSGPGDTPMSTSEKQVEAMDYGETMKQFRGKQLTKAK